MIFEISSGAHSGQCDFTCFNDVAMPASLSVALNKLYKNPSQIQRFTSNYIREKHDMLFVKDGGAALELYSSPLYTTAIPIIGETSNPREIIIILTPPTGDMGNHLRNAEMTLQQMYIDKNLTYNYMFTKWNGDSATLPLYQDTVSIIVTPINHISSLVECLRNSCDVRASAVFIHDVSSITSQSSHLVDKELPILINILQPSRILALGNDYDAKSLSFAERYLSSAPVVFVGDREGLAGYLGFKAAPLAVAAPSSTSVTRIPNRNNAMEAHHNNNTNQNNNNSNTNNNSSNAVGSSSSNRNNNYNPVNNNNKTASNNNQINNNNNLSFSQQKPSLPATNSAPPAANRLGRPLSERPEYARATHAPAANSASTSSTTHATPTTSTDSSSHSAPPPAILTSSLRTPSASQPSKFSGRDTTLTGSSQSQSGARFANSSSLSSRGFDSGARTTAGGEHPHSSHPPRYPSSSAGDRYRDDRRRPPFPSQELDRSKRTKFSS